MKRVWPTLLVLWPYAGLGVLWWTLSREPLTGVPLLCWLAALLVICIANVVCALRRKEGAVRVGCILKASLIPFYVCSFLLGMMMIAAPAGMIILLLLDALLLLTTSAYTLRGAYLLWRAGTLPGGWAILLAVSQLIFVLDVAGSSVLYAIEKRRSL